MEGAANEFNFNEKGGQKCIMYIMCISKIITCRKMIEENFNLDGIPQNVRLELRHID